MVKVEDYLNDGANWQAQAVLAYLKSQYSYPLQGTWNNELRCYKADFYVGRYENCREQGYVFSVRYMGEQRNYAVYEHRNSDVLCVVVFDRLTINTPSLDDVIANMKNKYDTTKKFKCGEILSCGAYILEDAKNFIDTINDLND
ncbi:MAG: hypothetical protein J6X18_00635 [Bacteroidales bacterium]|nr:hypothetical protein [Bacteroidales bacterium]